MVIVDQPFAMLRGHLEIIDIDTQDQAKTAVDVEILPTVDEFPSFLAELAVAVSFPADAAERMPVQGKAESADGMAVVAPRRRLLVGWEADPGVDWGRAAGAVQRGLRVGGDGIGLLPGASGGGRWPSSRSGPPKA